MRRKPRLARLLLLCSLSLPLTGQAFAVEAPGETAAMFRSGLQAFKAGDYQTALALFQSAAAHGYSSHVLVYNLGVTHFRLNQYEQARRYFRQLADEAEWRDLARYNLGLVAQRQGERAKEVDWFRLVANEAENDKLRKLAKQQLNELEMQQAGASAAGAEPHALVSVVTGYDDNVLAFPDELQQSASQGQDVFTELLAYGQAYAYGDSSNGILLHGFGFTRLYQDHSIFDTSAYGGGIGHQRLLGSWQLEYGVALSRTSVDGAELTTETQLNLRAWKDDGANRYLFYYRPGSHSAGDGYEQLEGTTQRVGAKWRHARGDWRWHVAYGLEKNDRQDLRADDMFFSYSPTRHQLELKTDWQAAPRWSFMAGMVFETAQYEGENRLIDVNGETRTVQRETDIRHVWVRSKFDYTDRWRLHLQWRQTNADDIFDLYAYQRSVLQLGLEYGF